MSRLLAAMLAVGLGLVAEAHAAAPDGWTLQLAWSPEFCAAELTSKEPQCTEERYFVVTGLQPRFDGGAPECSGEALDKEQAERWLVVIPNRAQIKKVWKRQGACSGLDPAGYFTQLERASRRVAVPAQYSGITEPLRTTRAAVKAAFIGSNPGLNEDAISLQCHGRRLDSVEICVDADFQFRGCGKPEQCSGDELRLRELRASREGREPIYR